MGDHDSIVDAKSLVSGVHTPSPVLRHNPHHLLDPFVATDTADDEHLLRAHVSHSSLRDLNEHGKHRLLQRKAQILPRDELPTLRISQLAPLHLRRQLIHPSQDATKRTIHPLDRIRQIEQKPPLLSQLLDVVPRRGIIRNRQRPRKAIQTVPHRDIQRLAEDAIPLHAVRDHLRVPSRDIQDDRIGRAGDLPPHLDVADTVVDADQGLGPQQAQRARRHRHALQRRAHAWAAGVADAVDVADAEVGFGEGGAHELDDPLAVVARGVFGEEAGAGWGDVGVAEVGEDLGAGVGAVAAGWVEDEAYAELVGGAFEAEGYHCGGGGLVTLRVGLLWHELRVRGYDGTSVVIN